MADRLTIPDVYPLLSGWVKRVERTGPLHLYVDDGNIKTHNIEFCLEAAEKGSEPYYGPDPEAAALCRLLLKMTTTQRKRMYQMLWEDRRVQGS